MWQSIVKKQMKYNRNMDIRRKVILFFEADKLGNVTLACDKLGYRRAYYYYWFNRLSAAKWDIKSLEELSRRPHSHPKTTATKTVKLIKKIRSQTGYGPARIAYYLQKDHGLKTAPSTIGHVLKREGLILARPRKAREKHTKRYQMPNPGDLIQMDVKYVPYLIRGQRYFQFTAIDDCSRWRFADIYPEKSSYSTKLFTKRLIKEAPFAIKCIQTDGGSEFTNQHISDPRCVFKEPAIHVLDKICAEHNIRHRLIPVATPQINGKVERSHRIDEEEFYRAKQYKDANLLKLNFQTWIHNYNHKRPHGGINMQTPAHKLFMILAVKNSSLNLAA